MLIQAPEGTKDLLPEEAFFWSRFKASAFETFSRYGYEPIETPLIEQTDLFVRSIGESTDVVSKEMFTAISGENLKKLIAGEDLKAKSRLSLRPEGTAGVVRAVVQHDLVPQGASPVKLMYAGSMFRAERPQKGRLRQFNQVGVECMGADDPAIDAEAIIMLMRFFTEIGIDTHSTRLLVNSMGCSTCRPAFREDVRAYIDSHADELCDTCKERERINPLRAFDCKNPACVSVMKGAPRITDYLCEDCLVHYEKVKHFLDRAQVTFEEDPTLVRGLDYYTRTVFEVQVDAGMGAQNAIGGGGRYDRLAEDVGGRPTPGFGFALGYERCVLALQAAHAEFPAPPACTLFVACVDDTVHDYAFELSQTCRDAGISVEMDYQHRSLKSQFKLADKLGAAFVAILGPAEIAESACKLRNMKNHDERIVALDEVVSLIAGA